MTVSFTKKTLFLSACTAALLLGGCGGGGGGGGGINTTPPPVAPPAPPPPPPPPPPPAPAPADLNDAEYQRSNAAVAANALAAWNTGATGAGAKIAIVDTGINPKLAEFTGRIDPASQDVAANRGITDTNGHGTAVSAVAAAAHNGADIEGVAFQATILSLNTSDPTTCGANSSDNCTHEDAAIARAIDLARTNGAKVINMSLGGDGASQTVIDAVARAAQAGIVIIVAAGNDGAAKPDQFALDISAQGKGVLIIAGATNASGQMASFSNLAGSASSIYLAALGDSVRAPDNTGTDFLWSGTSLSTPVISGAVALLASAFPNLTGQQIVQLLLTTADDAGAPGIDTTFGHGILDLARAFAPQGQTTIAGTSTPISVTGNGEASPVMGDAFSRNAPGAIILDGFGRAYALKIARTISQAMQDRPLAQAFSAHMRTGMAVRGNVAVSLTVDRRQFANQGVGLAQMGFTYEDSRKAHAVAGLAISRITPRMAVALGFSQSGEALKRQLAGRSGNAFLVARDPMERTGFYGERSTSLGIRQDIAGFGLTVTSERGKVYDPTLRFDAQEPRYSIGAASLDRQIGRATVSLGASRLSEQDTVLGARFSAPLAGGGATSYFLDTSASFDLGRGWTSTASYRRGWTRFPGAGLTGDGRVQTDAWNVDFARQDAFMRGDTLAFRLMQPLRVRSGALDMTIPVSYDYATGAVRWAEQPINLAPTGRELDFETAYAFRLWGGTMSANSFLRRQPGNIAAAGNDVGGALRFSFGF